MSMGLFLLSLRGSGLYPFTAAFFGCIRARVWQQVAESEETFSEKASAV